MHPFPVVFKHFLSWATQASSVIRVSGAFLHTSVSTLQKSFSVYSAVASLHLPSDPMLALHVAGTPLISEHLSKTAHFVPFHEQSEPYSEHSAFGVPSGASAQTEGIQVCGLADDNLHFPSDPFLGTQLSLSYDEQADNLSTHP